MKRYVVITLLCLAAAITVLLWGTKVLNGTEDQVTQEITISRGDPAALNGLTIKTAITCDQKLLWETTRDVSTGKNRTDFTFYGTPISMNYSVGSSEVPTYQIAFRLCDSYDENDTLCASLKKQDNGGGVSRAIRLKDYFDTYPLYLGECYFFTNIQYFPNFATNRDWISSGALFTPLRIPVAEDDFVEVHYYQNGPDVYYRDVNVVLSRLAHRYQAIAVACEGGALVTVGFAPDAEPAAKWAPGGFGIWMVPQGYVQSTAEDGTVFEENFFFCEQTKLIYPLDIEAQRVLAFQRSADEKSLLLVTAENSEAVLRVLDGQTYQLQSTVSLGKIATESETVTYYGDTGEYTVSQENDSAVVIHSEEAFTAIAVGDQLTVLLPTDSGYRVDFSCKILTLCSNYREGVKAFFWGDDPTVSQAERDSCNETSPIFCGYYCTFADMPMVYRDHKLAMAWYDDSDAAQLQVYGASGILYAERTVPSVLAQAEQMELYSFYLRDILPELHWIA